MASLRGVFPVQQSTVEYASPDAVERSLAGEAAAPVQVPGVTLLRDGTAALAIAQDAVSVTRVSGECLQKLRQRNVIGNARALRAAIMDFIARPSDVTLRMLEDLIRAPATDAFHECDPRLHEMSSRVASVVERWNASKVAVSRAFAQKSIHADDMRRLQQDLAALRGIVARDHSMLEDARSHARRVSEASESELRALLPSLYGFLGQWTRVAMNAQQ